MLPRKLPERITWGGVKISTTNKHCSSLLNQTVTEGLVPFLSFIIELVPVCSTLRAAATPAALVWVLRADSFVLPELLLAVPQAPSGLLQSIRMHPQQQPSLGERML